MRRELLYDLGKPLCRQSKAFPEIQVRLSDDVRKSVVFLGVEDDTPGGPGIRCCGTGFLISYHLHRYLVTVKHVALAIADAPFVIRINKSDGTSDNLEADVGDVSWVSHPDSDVDLTVVRFPYDLKKMGYDVKYIAGLEKTPPDGPAFECGDFTYTVGLFQLLAGKKRNLPVVHSGNIALLPSDEKIPVKSWEKPRSRKYVEAYLVQSESIQGLSGAPVFARLQAEMSDMPTTDGDTISVVLPRKDIGLLGVWQGAWDAPPDEVRAIGLPNEVRVPVGIGIVIPVKKIIEVLEMQVLKDQRKKDEQDWEEAKGASLDGAVAPPKAKDANPQHREDFSVLVGKAAKRKSTK